MTRAFTCAHGVHLTSFTTNLRKSVVKYTRTHTVKETTEALEVNVRAIFEWKKKWSETNSDILHLFPSLFDAIQNAFLE
jgi:hypothetical protein